MLTVIGVVGDVQYREVSDESYPTLYVLETAYGFVNHIVIRTTGSPQEGLAEFVGVVRNYDSRMIVTSSSALSDLVQRSIGSQRFSAVISMVFAVFAPLLATVSLFSLLARQVSDRREEIGIRMALGARPDEVYRMFVTEATKIVSIGILSGLPAAIVCAMFIRSIVFGADLTTLRAFLLPILALLTGAFGAIVVPARRASRLNATLALRRN